MTPAMDGAQRSFAERVRRYSGDMPVQAVLDELLRAGTVTRLQDGSVQLVNRIYLPVKDEVGKVSLLGNDVRDLIAAITHNLDAPAAQAYFQRKTSYNNLPSSALGEIRDAPREAGQVFLERFDRELATRDRDMNSAVSGDGRKRAVIGFYYFEIIVCVFSRNSKSVSNSKRRRRFAHRSNRSLPLQPITEFACANRNRDCAKDGAQYTYYLHGSRDKFDRAVPARDANARQNFLQMTAMRKRLAAQTKDKYFGVGRT